MSTTLSAADPSITYSPQTSWAPGIDGSVFTFAAGVTAELSFTGEFVQVYGALPPVKPGTPRPVSTYSLDNGPPLVFNSSANASSKEISSIFAFYQSPHLVDGVHSLLITPTENRSLFILDSIVYGSNNPNSSASPSPLSAAGTPAPPIPPPSSSPTSSSSADSDVSSSKLPVGGIVGGIIAALVLLAGLVAWLLIRRRMKQRTERHRTVTPFIASRNESRNSNRVLLSPVPQYIDEKASPPPFVPSPAAVAAQRGSMYKPGSSDALPPMEFGYGGGV